MLVFTFSAPAISPVLRMTSTTPTTISITWDEIPCLMRNGRIFRYVLSFCSVSVSDCQSLTTINNTSITNITFSGLIPRNSYTISIRADTFMERYFEGPLSSPVKMNTSTAKGVHHIL